MNILDPGRANGWSQCLDGTSGYLGYLQPDPITVEVPWNLQGPKHLSQKHRDWLDSGGNPRFEIPPKTEERLKGS